MGILRYAFVILYDRVKFLLDMNDWLTVKTDLHDFKL